MLNTFSHVAVVFKAYFLCHTLKSCFYIHSNNFCHFLMFWLLNQGPWACQGNSLPLHYTPLQFSSFNCNIKYLFNAIIHTIVYKSVINFSSTFSFFSSFFQSSIFFFLTFYLYGYKVNLLFIFYFILSIGTQPYYYVSLVISLRHRESLT